VCMYAIVAGDRSTEVAGQVLLCCLHVDLLMALLLRPGPHFLRDQAWL
jgi:hypothetical protein